MGVSLDGPEALHDEIRGMSGGFRKATEGIMSLVEARTRLGRACPMLHVTTVIQDANVDILHEMPAIARGIGADYLNLTLEIRSLDVLTAQERASGNAPEMVLPRIAPDRLKTALVATREAADSAGIELRLPRLPESQILRYYDGGLELGGCECPPAWMTLMIGRRGDVYPCFSCCIGNVRETPLRILNNNSKARAFRCALRRGLPDLCQGCCELVWRDGAGCP
jgi:MoaA/NifB/PqqE/SkfB family radical SAM enzyme